MPLDPGMVRTPARPPARPQRAPGPLVLLLAVVLLDTGEVQFRVRRYVRTEQIPNPVVRLGWATFGRLMQVVFVHRSMARMKRLVECELTSGRGTAGVPLAATRIQVNPDGADEQQRLTEQARH